jgi:adenylylsulfate kinase
MAETAKRCYLEFLLVDIICTHHRKKIKMVIWLCGLSGSGKSTIGNALFQQIKPLMPNLVLVDGDTIRSLFGNDLGFDVKSRIVQINRIQRIVKFLNEQELAVIVTALYSNVELLRHNRENFTRYFEVYVKTPIEILEKRDTKGLYKGARLGDIKDVVGVDIAWSEPKTSDLVANTEVSSVHEIVWRIIDENPHLSKIKMKLRS